MHYRRTNDKANEIFCTNTIQGSCAEFESLGEVKRTASEVGLLGYGTSEGYPRHEAGKVEFGIRAR